MPKPLTGDFRMHVTGEQVCGVAVSEIVESNARQRYSGSELIPSVRQAARLHRLAIFTGIHERFSVLSDSKLQQFLCLLDAVAAQFVNHKRRKRDSAGTAGFGFLQSNCLAGLFRALNNGKLPCLEIGIPPPKRGYLPAAQTAEQSE
jgi:hypothetical protein